MHRNHCFKLPHGNLKQYVAHTLQNLWCVTNNRVRFTPLKTHHYLIRSCFFVV